MYTYVHVHVRGSYNGDALPLVNLSFITAGQGVAFGFLGQGTIGGTGKGADQAVRIT